MGLRHAQHWPSSTKPPSGWLWPCQPALLGTAGGHWAPGRMLAAPLDTATLFWEEERFAVPTRVAWGDG